MTDVIVVGVAVLGLVLTVYFGLRRESFKIERILAELPARETDKDDT